MENREGKMGDVLREIVFQSDWSLLPEVRESWSRGEGLGTLKAKEVAIRLAAVVGAVRCYCGSVVESEGLGEVRDYVYRYWDPRVLGEVAVDVLIDFGPKEKERMREGSGTQFIDYYVGGWKVRPVANSKTMPLMGKAYSELADYVTKYGRNAVFVAITGLDDPEIGLPLLKVMGVFDPETTLVDFAGKIGVDSVTIQRRIKRGVIALGGKLADVNIDDDKIEIPVRDRLVVLLERMVNFKSGKKTIGSESPRVRLTQLYQKLNGNGLAIKMLTPAVWKVVSRLVVDSEGEVAHQTIARIALELDINESFIYKCIDTALAVWSGEKRIYLGCDGRPLKENRYPLTIIRLVKGRDLTNFVPILPPLLGDILTFIMEKKDGCYHTREEIEKKFGGRCTSIDSALKQLKVELRRLGTGEVK